MLANSSVSKPKEIPELDPSRLAVNVDVCVCPLKDWCPSGRFVRVKLVKPKEEILELDPSKLNNFAVNADVRICSLEDWC